MRKIVNPSLCTLDSLILSLPKYWLPDTRCQPKRGQTYYENMFQKRQNYYGQGLNVDNFQRPGVPNRSLSISMSKGGILHFQCKETSCLLPRPLQRSKVVIIDLLTLYLYLKGKAVASPCWVEGRGRRYKVVTLPTTEYNLSSA
jgi:hypothetical protein